MVVPHKDVTSFVEKIKTQKSIVIEHCVVHAANHFFDGKIDALMTSVVSYLDKRLEVGPDPRKGASAAPLRQNAHP
jgi:uncharacterized protein